MKVLSYILAILFIIAGGVWFLQGINVLPGSFMTGQLQWALYGAIALLAGVGLLAFANRLRR